MLITDKTALLQFNTENRIWQGIPSIEVTKGGRIFLTFYSGGTKEEIGNFSIVLKSDDGGKSFSEPIIASYIEGKRCFDPNLWIDPLGRLWFTWGVAPDGGVFASICENPDDDILVFGEPFFIGGEVMMNKPTVLSTGEWLFPSAVWKDNMRGVLCGAKSSEEQKAYAFKTTDCGRTFQKLGGVDIKNRAFDEHMILEQKDNTLSMFVRTTYGIGVSHSLDGGKTWSSGEDSGLGGPCSRFFMRRLKSGRILLINHINFTGRNNLTALLSEDDGKTWKYSLLLDERDSVSYPDAKESDDGYIYITYDRERGSFKNSIAEAYADAREILIAKISEDDIIAGELKSKKGFLKCVASKLSKYAKESENPYGEIDKFSKQELAEKIVSECGDNVVGKIFEYYPVNCINMHTLENGELDRLIDNFYEKGCDKVKIAEKIIDLVRSVAVKTKEINPIVDRIKEKIIEKCTEDFSVEKLAETIGISKYYMLHLFKKYTGVTVVDFKNEMRLIKAKKLLVNSDTKISEIAYECGFSSASYFSKIFIQSEKISPSEYRKKLKKKDELNMQLNMDDKDKILYNMLDKVELMADINVKEAKKDNSLESVIIPVREGFEFLHEAAIIKYKDTVFAAWYNCPKHELTGNCPICFSMSDDDGKTWCEPKILAEDKTGKILYCPPVFGIDDGKLYMFINQMVSPDHIHSLDFYVYDEKNKTFECLWSRPIPFKLNTNVYKMENGKLIMPGRIAKLDGFPNTPAVLISDSGKIDAEWRVVKIQENGTLPDGSEFVHPEVSLIIDKNKIYAFSRNDNRNVPIVYISEDFGENWSEPKTHNIPLSKTKLYSGTLSDGRRYLIGNVIEGRKKLALFLSEPKEEKFSKCIVIQDGFSEKFGFGEVWHYPSAFENDGKLYVIYTVSVDSGWIKRRAVVTVIDLKKI